MVHRYPNTGLAALKSGAVAALLLAGCTSTGQLDSIGLQLSEISRQVQVLQADTASNEELAAVEGRLAVGSDRLLRAEADILVEVNRLADQILALEEQLKDTLYRIDQLSQQVASTNQELKALVAAPAVRVTEGGRLAGNPGAPETLYDSAYAHHESGNHRLAILGFQEFLATFPEAEQADNALYWIGESYFSQDQFSRAIAAFSEVLARYPASEKVASARLRRGIAYLKQGDREEGMNQLRELVLEHPSSAEATFAREELSTLEAGN